MDHPDYLEDDFYPEDYFVWPVGHSDYPDLSQNADEEDIMDDEESSDEGDIKELDIVDPINHPVHWIPERQSAEYSSIDPRHYYDYHADDGPVTEGSKLHVTHRELTHLQAEQETDDINIHYTPTYASERHPLPVDYDYDIHNSDEEPINPLHPLEAYRYSAHGRYL